MTVRYIQVEPLTCGAYRPFGHVIGIPEQPPLKENDERSYWLSPEIELLGGTFAVVYAQMRMVDYVVRRLHRHTDFAQTFIPLGGVSFIHVVAPGDDVPDLGQLRAFLISGDQGVIIGRGMWHRNPAYPLAARGSLVLLSQSKSIKEEGMKGGTTQQVELCDLTSDEIRLRL